MLAVQRLVCCATEPFLRPSHRTFASSRISGVLQLNIHHLISFPSSLTIGNAPSKPDIRNHEHGEESNPLTNHDDFLASNQHWLRCFLIVQGQRDGVLWMHLQMGAGSFAVGVAYA